MSEIIQPNQYLREALEHAIPAAPIDPEHLVLDAHRVNEALAARANVLSGEDSPAEAEIARTDGGYSRLPLAERRVMQVNIVRQDGRELVDARHAFAGKELA